MNRTLKQLATPGRLPWLWALLTLPFGAWVMLKAYGSINVDGILYVEVAKQFADGHWHEGFALYKWPFYPLLIAVVHKLTGFDFELSAHCLDDAFFAILAAGLLTLVRDVGGDRRAMIAAGVLLFASPTIARGYLPMVMRDYGYWASHLWSVIFFLRFYERHRWPDAWSWGALAAVATLFRIEGLTYMVLLPLAILLQKSPDKKRAFIKANSVLLMAALGLGFALLIQPTLELHKLGRLGDPVNLLQGAYQQLSHGLREKTHIYADKVLGNFLSDYALDGLLLTLLYILLFKAVSAAGWLQFILAAIARKYLSHASLPKFQQIFAWLIVLGITPSALEILSVFLLPKRYLMPIGLVLLVYAAFGLAALYGTWRQASSKLAWNNWKFPLAGALIAIQCGITLAPGQQKKSVEIAVADWLKQNASTDSRIYADSARLRYYANANQPFRRDFITPDEIQGLFTSGEVARYDYILATVADGRQSLESTLTERMHSAPAAIFNGGNGKRILIYRVVH